MWVIDVSDWCDGCDGKQNFVHGMVLGDSFWVGVWLAYGLLVLGEWRMISDRLILDR